MIARIGSQWAIHGLPRCDAYFALTNDFCRRLIWPWQQCEGPESLAHSKCRSREQWELDEHERLNP